MTYVKLLADSLTLSRFLIGIWIAFLGLSQGSKGLFSAILWLLIAWLTDILDGHLARKSQVNYQTWIGEHDLYADMTVSFGVLLYLTFSKFISLFFTIIFLLLTFLGLWFFPSNQLANAFQAVPYGLMIYTAFRNQLRYGLMIILYLLLLIIVTWPRFPKEKVPEFINGMKDLRKFIKKK